MIIFLIIMSIRANKGMNKMIHEENQMTLKLIEETERAQGLRA